MLAWAEEYLPVAQQNRALLGPYEVIEQRVAAGDLVAARERLTELWRQAPYFRDPGGVAPPLGLVVPRTYEEAKERRLADEAKDKRNGEAARIRDEERSQISASFQGRINQVTTQGKKVLELVSGLRDAKNPEDCTKTSIERRLSAWGWESGPPAKVQLDVFLRRLSDYTVVLDRERNVSALISRQWEWDSYMREHMALAVVVIVAPGVLIGGVIGYVDPSRTLSPQLQAMLGSAIVGGFISAIATPVALGIFYIPWFLAQRGRASTLALRVRSSKESVDSAYSEWLRAHQLEIRERIQQIESERSSAIASANNQYQQRLVDIAAEHARALADIAARYGSAEGAGSAV